MPAGYAQQPNQDIKSAILARRAIWNKAIVERDFDTLAGLTTPDSSRIGPAARIDGPEQNKAFFVGLLKRRPDLVYERTPIRVEGQDGLNFAHEIGTWRERWTESDGPTELQGDYFVLWRQIGGEWKEQADVFSPSRCVGKSYCVAHPAPSPTPVRRGLAQAHAGWYPLSESDVLGLYRKKINLSTCLAGQAVGIKEVDNGIWLVSFMDYDLGYIDLEEKTLQPLNNPFGPKVLPMS